MITENVIRTVIEIIGKGDVATANRIEKIHKNLVSLQATEAERGRSYTGMRGALNKYARQTEEIASRHAELNKKTKDGATLTNEEQKEYNEGTIQMGRYQKNLEETTLSKKRFGDELKKLQARAKVFPKDIRNWTAQQSLLNRAQQQGTITMATYKNKIEPVNKELDKLQKGQGRNILQAAKWALMWFVLYRAIRVVVGGVGDVIRSYSELANEMGRVMAVTDAQGKQAKDILKMQMLAVIAYGAKSIASFRDIAEAMYHLKTAGMTTEQAMAGFASVMNLTTGTLGNVTEIARLVAGSFNLFGEQLRGTTTDAERFKYIADLLAFAYAKHQVELSEISSAMGYVASSARMINMPFEQLVGTIAFLNQGLLRGSKAGTSLMNAFVQLASDSERLSRLLGVTFDPNKPLDFYNIMKQLHERYKDGIITQKEMDKLMDVFGLRGIKAVEKIITQWDEWNKSISMSHESVDEFAEMMKKKMEDTLPRAIKKLGNAIKADLMPSLVDVGEKLKDIINKVLELKGAGVGLLEAFAKTLGLKEFEEKLGRILPWAGWSKFDIRGIAGETDELSEGWQRVAREISKAQETGEKLSEAEKETAKQNAINAKSTIERLKTLKDLQEYEESLLMLSKLQALGLGERAEIILDIRQFYKDWKEQLKDLYDVETFINEVLGDRIRFQEMINILSKDHITDEKELKKLAELRVKAIMEIKKPWLSVIATINTALFNLSKNFATSWGKAAFEWQSIMMDVIDSVGEAVQQKIILALTNKLTGNIPWFAGPLGAIAGGLISGLGALIFGGGQKEQEKIREATLDVSAGIDISNEQLAIINRNIVALRQVETYPMMESYYFRQRRGIGVQIQGGVTINMPPGSDGENVVKAIEGMEESFGIASSRVYQPS